MFCDNEGNLREKVRLYDVYDLSDTKNGYPAFLTTIIVEGNDTLESVISDPNNGDIYVMYLADQLEIIEQTSN